jgi:iron complex outermembrane receptor protein
MVKTRVTCPILAMTAAALLLATGLARSQSSDVALEEVIVTAQKREERLIDVPAAISVFSAGFIEEHRIQSIDDLIKYTPGLTGTTYGASNPTIVIRGLSGNDFGSGADATFGVYLNEVFVGRKTASVFDLIDVERMEVVKGPQGTLFGRNSTAGAVSVTTRRPGPDFESAFTARAGNYGYWQGDAAVNAPLTESFYMRAAFRARSSDGYVDNLLDDNSFPKDDQTLIGRLSFRWLPTENVDVLIAADGHSHDGNTPALKSSYQVLAGALGVTPETAIAIFSPGESLDPYSDAATNLPDSGSSRHVDDQDIGMLTAHIQWEASESLTVTSITAYREYDVDFGADDDATPLTALHTFQVETGDQFSQEFRLNGTSGRLTWFLGASVLDEEVDVLGRVEYDESLYLIGPRTLVEERVDSVMKNLGWAVYGDATLALSDKLSLSAGIRYSEDDKEFLIHIPPEPVNGFNIVLYPTADPPLLQEETYSAWQPRFALKYSWSENMTSYINVARGFRAGGFNNFSAQEPFNPEYVWSYELGLKGRSADGRFSADAAAFYYNYEDLQVLLPVGGAFLVENAAEATGYGIELALAARPADRLELIASLTWLEAEYDEFIRSPTDDRSGNKLTRAPELKGSLGIQYTLPLGGGLSGFVGADYAYESEQFFNSQNSAFASQGAYSLVGAALGLERDDERWRITAYADNLLDEEYLASAGGLFGDTTRRGTPLFYGVELSLKF